MARHRRRTSKRVGRRTSCPQPFDAMIDIAQAFTLSMVASHMNERNRYSGGGKVNPYAVSGIGISTGAIKDAGDLAAVGAVLGAMGAFDDDGGGDVSNAIASPGPAGDDSALIDADAADEAVYEEIPEPACFKRIDPYADDDLHVYIYCLVKIDEADEPIYYLTEDRTLRNGNHVTVASPDTGELVCGEILSIAHHMRFSVPVPPEDCREIIDRADTLDTL